MATDPLMPSGTGETHKQGQKHVQGLTREQLAARDSVAGGRDPS